VVSEQFEVGRQHAHFEPGGAKRYRQQDAEAARHPQARGTPPAGAALFTVASSTPCSSSPATVALARVLEKAEPAAKASREMLLDQKTWSSRVISLVDKPFQRAKLVFRRGRSQCHAKRGRMLDGRT
jgi:hypothetical protein